MRTYPFFVPAGDGRVATVVTLPDADPEGFVVVLAGIGRHHVIGGTMAGRLSARLASHGLATVRLDYGGVGDSPGIATSWTSADVDRAVEEARVAARTVGDAIGVSQFVGVGTCYGSRVVLRLVEESECVGAVCLAPPIVDPGSIAATGGAIGKRRIVATVRSTPILRPLVSPVLRRLRRGKPSRRALGALSHLDRARIAFLYGTPPTEDHYSSRVRESIDAALDGLPAGDRERFELQMLDIGPLTTFDGLDDGEQRKVLDIVVPYVRACFEQKAG